MSPHQSFIRSELLRIVLNFVLCVCTGVLQGAGRVDEAAGGQCFYTGKKRTSEGAGEAAAENGAERRADQ